MVNNIPSNGIVHITLPKWNPSSPAPQSIFNSADATCTEVTNVSGISCTTVRNLNGNFNQDKLLVQGTFSIPTGNTVAFNITNYLNPPSFEPFTFISVYTTTDNQNDILDQNDAVILTMSTAATLPVANVNITAANSETNQITSYNFSMQVTNPLPLNSRIEITIPAEITITTTSPTGIGIGKISSRFSTFYDSTSRVLQLTDIIDSSTNYVYSNEIISFVIQNIQNPPTTAPTGTITILTLAGVGYNIETNTNPITFTATGGNILTFTITPSLTSISHRVQYEYTFVTENPISIGSSLTITYPSQISPGERTNEACVTLATNINTAALCNNITTSAIQITGGFTTAVASGTSIVFTIGGNKNPPTVQPSSGFLAVFQDSSGNIIDSYTASDTAVTITSSTDSFESFTVTPGSTVTGATTSYTFAMDATVGVLLNSVFSLVIPADLIITDIEATRSSCISNNGFNAGFTCALVLNSDSTHTLTITGGFPTTDINGLTLNFTIGNIRNPRSTTPSLSFKAYINDENNYGQYATESGVIVSMVTPSDFTNVALTRSSTVNAESTSYTFTITLNNQITNGDYIQVIFPTEILVQSTPVQCTGVTNLQTSLVCSVNGQTVDMQVALSTGLTILPTTVGATDTSISFSINNVRNPYLLSTTATGIIINSYTNTKKYLIDRRSPAMTVTNTAAGSIIESSVVPVNSALGITTDYLISFKPNNDILQNTIVKLTIPSELVINTTVPFTCTRVLVIESTLTCTYDDATRVVTLTDGFLTRAVYESSQIEFKITSIINPSEAITTSTFSIITENASGVVYNSKTSGITYTKQCNSPCLTWQKDLTTCTSWNTSSTTAYLSGGTWVSSCPSGEYNDNFVWQACQAPWATCNVSATNCILCTSDPQLYLLDSKWVTSCPRLYEIGSDGVSCDKVGELTIPFIGLGLWLLTAAVLGCIKAANKTTMFLSSFIAFTCYLLALLQIVLVSLLYRDKHYQSGSMVLLSFVILVVLNICWNWIIYKPEIRPDILYSVWTEAFPKTEKFVYVSSYLFWFQCFRLSFCQLAGRPRYDASMKNVDMILIKLNRFSFFHILLVVFPTIAACIYNLFWTRYLRQVFWHDIEMIVIMTGLVAIVVLDVWMKDESALEENYVDKKEFSKNIDITDKSLLTHTILNTKDEIATSRYFKKDYEIHGRECEEDVVREVYHNHFKHSAIPKVMDFDNLIHKAQDGEVVSQHSIDGVKKECNMLDPFREKYQEMSPKKPQMSMGANAGNNYKTSNETDTRK